MALTHVQGDMEPCHSGLGPRSPATSTATVAHLIRNIEQLKNKDKLISQLEQDLGQSWAAAHLAALEQQRALPGGPPSPALLGPSALPEGSSLMEPTSEVVSWTPPPALTTGTVEVERSTGDEGFALGNEVLPKTLKDCKDRNKVLADKCRTYLQKNKELTAQNRAFKDRSDNTLQEHRKMHELLEHSKLRILQLSRQLSELTAERTNNQQQNDVLEQMKKEMLEDKKRIGALRQACSEKDRRIELIQHRKKRRRIMRSAEKNAGRGLRETFFGYDEDTTSIDSENSFSSSVSTCTTISMSDDELWDDVLSREETERNYHRLMMEQLQLQKSHSLLQSQTGHAMQDPQREALTRSQVQHDLFQAQCRIEHLEKLINEMGEGEMKTLLKERDTAESRNRILVEKLNHMKEEIQHLQKELATTQEREEDLEFRLMEYEHQDEDNQNSSCGESASVTQRGEDSPTSQVVTPPPPPPAVVVEVDPSEVPLPEGDLLEQTKAPPVVAQAPSVCSPSSRTPGASPRCVCAQMEKLYGEIAGLLKGRGKQAEAALHKLEGIKDLEQKATSLESMAHELQMKVIHLQKERDSLQDELAHRGGKQAGGVAAAVAASRERQENLELKAELERLAPAYRDACDERSLLREEVDDWKAQYDYLKQQLDILTHDHSIQRKKVTSVRTRSLDSTSSGDSSPPSPGASSGHQLRTSKDRKSKSRCVDDSSPQSKRRKSDQSSSDIKESNMLRSFQSFGDIKSVDENHQGLNRNFKSSEDIKSKPECHEESQKLTYQVTRLESELLEAQSRNSSLEDQLKQAALEKSTEAEADQQMLLDKLRAMDTELSLLRRENVALGEQLRQRVEEFHDSQGEMQPRTAELEDFCEDLQERLHGAEISERQLKEKLKLIEASIEEAEISEMSAREDNEKLLAREEAARNHIVELQRTVRELKDIILDKDIVEQALRDKVDFLQKAEAASVERIEELEAVERDLRELLEQNQNGGSGVSQREANKIQELKHQLTFLETDNKALNSRVAELEENEETLRENWRRVADEDFNRTQCLEEKVKLLESLNRDLKSKLSDAQEYYVINAVPSANTSLAAELARSQSKTSISDLSDTAGDHTDGTVEGGEGVRQGEEKVLKEKVRKLERQLSDVSELKNSKIEQLQEKIGSLRENEIKLSETITEMEMTERELRAKVALYESSEVTVEKMLKYQSKIEELRTSQESLLDQLESMENQEMTLQEKMQEMERTLRGKIVSLEVEMKNLKQKELKAASRIRDLEKQEKDLSEKLSQQAEKENGLYIKISSLKDELSASKAEVETLKVQIAEKEDKVRKCKLLEVKLLEIEMEFGKKSSALSSKLRHKEEELRQKEVAHEQEKSALKEELNQKVKEQDQRTAILESIFAHKEEELRARISFLEVSVQELTCERDEYEAQIKDLMETNQQLKSQNSENEKELTALKENMGSSDSAKEQHEKEVASLHEKLQEEKQRADDAKSDLTMMESELKKEKQTVTDIENKMVALKENISQKMKCIETSFAEKESEHEREKQSLQSELKLKEERVNGLKNELNESHQRVNELEKECEKLRQDASVSSNLLSEKRDLENSLSDSEGKCQKLESELQKCQQEHEYKLSSMLAASERNETILNFAQSDVEEKNRKIHELNELLSKKQEEFESQLSTMKSEKETLENDLQSKVSSLTSQLNHEVAEREVQQSALSSTQNRELTLSTEITQLKGQLEQSRLELVTKLSELETKNEEMCQLSLELSQTRHAHKTLQNEHDTLTGKSNSLNLQISDLKEQLEEKESELYDMFKKVESQKEDYLELDTELKNTRESLNKLKAQFNTSMTEWEGKEEKLCNEIKEKELDLEKVFKDLKQARTELNSLRSELDQKDQLLSDVSSDKEQILQKQSEMEKVIEHKSLQEVMVQEQMQKSEAVLQESKLERETKEAEIAKLSQLLEEKDRFSEQQLKEFTELTCERENLVSQIASLEKRIVTLEVEIEDKETSLEEDILNLKNLCNQKECDIEKLQKECEALQEESSDIIVSLESKIAQLEMDFEMKTTELYAKENEIKSEADEKQIKDSEIKHLLKELNEKDYRLHEAEQEIKNYRSESLSEVSAKQEQIGHYQNELQRCLDDIEKCKNDCEIKENKLIEVDQTYKTSLKEQQELTLQLQEKDQKCVTMESEMATMELRLVEAENRYRQLEARYSSLELELEEKFSQHVQEAQQVVLHKDQERAGLQQQLTDLEKQLSSEQTLLAEKIQECSQLDDKLGMSVEEVSQVKSQLASLKSEIETHKMNEKEAKIRENSLCSQVEELERKYDNATQKLKSTEDRILESKQHCEVLEKKLVDIEFSLHQKNSECITLTSNVSELEKRNLDAHSEIQTAHLTQNNLEVKCDESENRIKLLEESLQERNAQYEAVLSDLNDATSKHEEKCKQCNDLKNTMKEAYETSYAQEKNIEHLKSRLSSTDNELQEKMKTLDELQEKIMGIENALLDKETDHMSGLVSLEQKHLENQEQCQELESKYSKLEILYEEKSLNLQHSEETLSDLRSRYEDLKDKFDHAEEELQTKSEDLNKQVECVRKEQHSRALVEKEAQTVQSKLQSTIHELEEECIKLQDKLNESENILQSCDEDCSNLTKRNVELSEELSTTQLQLKDTQKALESIQGENQELESENSSLQRELEEAGREFENIRDGFEESRIGVESKMVTLSASKERLEKDFSELEWKYDEQDKQLQSLLEQLREKENEHAYLIVKQSELEDKGKELDSARKDKDSLQKELTERVEKDKEHIENQTLVKELQTEILDLKDKLAEFEDLYSNAHFENSNLVDELSHVNADNTVLETQVSELQHQLSIEKAATAKVEARLQTLCDQREEESDVVSESDISVSMASSLMCSSSGGEDVDDNDNEIQSERQSEEQIQKLCDILELNHKELNVKKIELDTLQSEIKKAREREGKLSKRVSELETQEKDLLEQMADIEQTVIIPLETENQELKDELSLVKEERDEAMASVVKMGGDENVDSLNDSLEEALVQKAELEKQMNDLNKDNEFLESERMLLIKRISGFESKESEYIGKVQSLEKRLQQTTVVEETETRLMDKVLDLEDRERNLIRELNELKNKTEVEKKDDSQKKLIEQVNYLAQKNEVLQDAECKYMDRILELEEHQETMQRQLELAKSSQEQPVSESNKEISDTILPSQSAIFSQTAPTLESSARAPAASVDRSTDTEDLISPSEQYTETAQSENSVLKSEINAKDVRIQYLEEKLQLLQDSEAKLMESMLDMEEKPVQKSEAESELQKKVENLLEENEFLAESVENYKKLYKEEKEKCNELQVKIIEDSSALHELHEAQTELRSTQSMVEDIQSEYEEQLSQKNTELLTAETQIKENGSRILQLQNELENAEREHRSQVASIASDHTQILNQKEVTIQALEQSLASLQEAQYQENQTEQENINLRKKIHYLELQVSQMHSFSEISELQDKVHNLEHQNEGLLSQVSEQDEKLQSVLAQNDQLQQTIESHELVEENLHTQEKLKVQELQGRVDAMTQRRDELRAQHRIRESQLQEEVDALGQRETTLLKQVEDLQCQLRQLRARLDNQESQHSDSGLSVDEHRNRSGSSGSHTPDPVREVFSSRATLQLARPASAPIRQVVRRPHVSHGFSTPPPVAPPRAHRRGSKSRPQSVDYTSQDELDTLVDDTQAKEAVPKRRIQSLGAATEKDRSKQSLGPDSNSEHLEKPIKHVGGRVHTRSPYLRPSSRGDEDEDDLNRSFSSVLSASSSIMLDKPEDVLHQRIKELEGLDKYNKTQLSELERDREVLHEIARKDKTTIHDLNVKIRELQLSERSLKEQVSSLEVSENSLFSKCDELEAHKTRLEDRVHELEIHERRLRELVRRLKLDEERWLSKSGGMETAVAELSANEQQLKRVLKDVEMEKGGLNERAQYLEARIRELENVEATLVHRIKTYETNEVSLQNRLVQLENAEAASHSKATELDVMNMDLSQRLQKAVEENAVLSQHITQLHGQVQELDRRLMSSQDSELAYKQHVESLQKNESSLQKKVREYELREIDSQARIRELEQTEEINKDKLAALQRSENRLKYRIQELEGIGAQIPGELSPGQRQAVPQRLEDCQKRVVVLQAQVENLQLQLRQTLTATTQDQPATQGDDTVTISRDDFAHLQTRSSLLEETEYQMDEVEHLNEQLSDTILQLRQGKGASGHEVEIEVLKKRLASYKTFINQLKSSLLTGQATSLGDTEPGSGPKGESSPPTAPYLPGLASERVLQSIRGIPEQGKATTSADNTGVVSAHPGLHPQSSLGDQPTAPSPVFSSTEEEAQGDPASSREEDLHWRAIEARRPKHGTVAGSRGGAPNATANQGPTENRGVNSVAPYGSKPGHHEMEEVTIGLDLYSESDLSSYHRYTNQNDTDSSLSPVPPPRRGRSKADKTYPSDLSSSENETSELRPAKDLEAPAPSGTAAAANDEHFDKHKSLPSQATPQEQPIQQTQRPPLSRFADDSFYLPSPAQERADSIEDEEDEPPPLPTSRPPNMGEEVEEEEIPPTSRPQAIEERTVSPTEVKQVSNKPPSRNSPPGSDRQDSLNNSTNGMSIRDRIAMIEKQLQSEASGAKGNDDQVLFWKKQSTEALKQADTLSRENKYLNEEISRLEKELEEKRRYINLLEIWLTSLEDLLKNKNKQTDREMVEELQLELTKLRTDLRQVGYRPEDAVLDSAALKTELEHRDREILTKKQELEVLSQELAGSREECRSVEVMRRTALDSLRQLEKEAVVLQDKDDQLQAREGELRGLKAQYDEMERFKNQAVGALHPLQSTVDKLSAKCQEKDALLRRLASELRRSSYHRPNSVLDDLTRLEQALALESYNGTQGHQGPGQADRIREGIRSSSMDELDMPFSDDDSMLSGPTTGGRGNRHKRPTSYVNMRPRSAEALRSPEQRSPRGTHAHSRSHLNWRSEVRVPSKGQFVAIRDYDPNLFSQSGRPHLELPMRERDQVIVTGPMDGTGYYEAVVNGQSGLVPASYLQPLQVNGHSPPQVLDGTGQAPHPAFRDMSQQHHHQSPPSTHHPDPPHHLEIKRVIDEKSILLSWSPPPTDGEGKNKGFKVLGYMVYLDNKEYEQVPCTSSCEVVVEGLTADQHHLLAVQCLCGGGFASSRAELVLEGMITVSKVDPSKQQQSKRRASEDLDTDLSSVLNSIQYKKGQKKMVMALYDYNPEEQSPHDYTALELAFSAGDVIHVYGEPRKDGFYHGEIHGSRGLVPACFVEELAKMKKGNQRRKDAK